MGRHSEASRRTGSSLPTILVLAVGTTATLVAWGYLVSAAIDFGVLARAGSSGAWVFLGFSSLGAMACLFVALILIARTLRALGFVRDYQPRRSAGRRSR